MGNQFLWKDSDGVNRWHDHKQPAKEYPAGVAKDKRCGSNGWATGLKSLGAGVHFSQVKEFRTDAKQHGFTGVEFSNDGECVFTSRGERARYLKHRGLVDRDGGYGD